MKTEITSQYRASLKMLLEAVSNCPDTIWADESHKNVYWRIIYHTLFYTDLYLAENEHSFKRWDKHLPDYHRLGKVTDEGQPIEIASIYSKDDLLGYATSILENVEARLQLVSLTEPSGFDWLPMNKFELHLYKSGILSTT